MTGTAGQIRRRLGPGAAILAVAGMVLAGAARGSPLVADLSEPLVKITIGFTGAELLLFGAVENRGDVVVVVRGPDQPVVLHRKSRILGVWVNAAKMTFDRAPGFYAVASSGPLDKVATESVRAREELGIDHLRLDLPRAKASPNVAAAWRNGLVRNRQRLGLYASDVGKVTFLGNQLFRAEIKFPDNVPTGNYLVQVYYLRDGRIVAAQTRPLRVEKSGIEAEVFDFAYNHSALYGLFAIVVALVAGWAAHLAFKKS